MTSERLSAEALRQHLRLMHVSPGHGDLEFVTELLRRSLRAGVSAVQIREPQLSASDVARLCERLRPAATARSALILVNDRADVVAAGLADGVQLGYRSLGPTQVRSFLDVGLIGCSVHTEGELAAAVGGGADYVILSPVHATRGKPLARPLGVATAEELTRSCPVPVVWLGGFDAVRVAAARAEGVGAAGFAVQGALAQPDTVDDRVRALRTAAESAAAPADGEAPR